MLKIVVATNNTHKIQELRAMLSNSVILYSLKDVGIKVDPNENGKTYAENAFIKANEVAKYTSLPVLSDDSGIEIEKLGDHFPGIYSHRYAMEHGGQEKLNALLTKTCNGSKAIFTSHFVLLNLKPGQRLDFTGYMYGKINNKVEGINGFGYDPIFVPDGYTCSVSLLSPEEKNKISHRYNAAKELLSYLRINNYL